MAGEVKAVQDGQSTVLTFSNPGRLNALDSAMWAQLEDLLQDLLGAPNLRCLVIRGEGDSAFSSGADISEFDEVRSDAAKAITFSKPVHRCFHLVRSFPVPTVAAIRGVCAGGGFELAGCCDLRICSRDSTFGIPINRIGATLCYAELEILIRAFGEAVALELLLEGRMLDAGEALAKGIVTRVVDGDGFEAELAATVRRITSGSPLAARWHKMMVQRLRSREPLTDDDIQEGFASLDNDEYRRGYRSFLAKRDAGSGAR